MKNWALKLWFLFILVSTYCYKSQRSAFIGTFWPVFLRVSAWYSREYIWAKMKIKVDHQTKSDNEKYKCKHVAPFSRWWSFDLNNLKLPTIASFYAILPNICRKKEILVTSLQVAVDTNRECSKQQMRNKYISADWLTQCPIPSCSNCSLITFWGRGSLFQDMPRPVIIFRFSFSVNWKCCHVCFLLYRILSICL